MRKTLSVILFLLAFPLFADSAKRIEREATVAVPRADVWRAWTTRAGLQSFVVQDAKIEMTPGGAYEFYFNMAEPPGSRGGETNQVIAFEPERWLLFSWNAPPKFGALRNEHTYVLMRFDDAPGGGTRVRLTHFGWREAKEWDEIYKYFESAWSWVMQEFVKKYGG